jgi:hypothetical protein
MFRIPKTNTWNGRIFSPPPGVDKSHNKGSTSGLYWYHEKLEYQKSEKTYVTEGIIDALSLIEMGCQAIAILSSGQNPEKLELNKLENLVFAFDNDEAGKKALRRWQKVYPKAEAVMLRPGEKIRDWNDFLVNYKDSAEAKKAFDRKYEEFKVQAKLALAKKAVEYADVFFKYHKYPPGLFPFDGCYYWSYQKKTKDDSSLETQRISNFTLEVRYYQLDNSNPREPTYSYRLEVFPRKGRAFEISVSGKDLATPTSLTQIFLTRAKVMWEGNKQASHALARMVVEAGAPLVRQLNVIGYDDASGAYVFKDFLIDIKGKYRGPDKRGFFEVSKKEYVKPPSYKTILPDTEVSTETTREIYKLIYRAWNMRGLVAIAWVVASWFVNQIKELIGFFPFLSFCGETQTGKSWLSRNLNALQAIDEEGLPMAKVNTMKGEIRKIAQRSGLFKSLLEGNDPEKSRFDYESILPLYNDNPLQTRARISNDRQTHELPFKSALLFVQNKEPFKSRAAKERVVSLYFERKDINEETTEAFDKLVAMSRPQLAGFFVKIMSSKRPQIEEKWFQYFQKAKSDLKKEIIDPRITETHAIILAFHRILTKMMSFSDTYDLTAFIAELGQRKVKACQHREETLADYFFQLLDDLSDAESKKLTEQDREEGLVYIWFAEAIRFLKKADVDLPRTYDLQKSLKEHSSYVDSNITRRLMLGRLSAEPTKVWVFKADLIA